MLNQAHINKLAVLFVVILAVVSISSIVIAAPPEAMVTNCALVTQISQIECETLVALYNNTNGPYWTYNTGWLTTNTPCSWYGIRCNSLYGYGDNQWVFDINLEHNNLNGTLPDLSALTRLALLDITNSPNLRGPLPNFSSLTQLQEIRLGSNNFTGSIPDLSRLSKVRLLVLSNNQLTGPVPNLSGMTSLEYLNLAGNQLSGNLPPWPNNLYLTQIYLNFNQLTGPIPDLSPLPELVRLNLDHNQLSGPIPDLSALTKLKWLILEGNQLSGPIPDLSNLVNLSTLYLANNQLSGEAPEEIMAIGTHYIDLRYNMLTTDNPTFVTYVHSRQQCTNGGPCSFETQTVPVTDLATNVTPTSVEFTWTPIDYVEDGGYYEISYSNFIAGPWTVEHTTDKTATGYTVNGLDTSRSYYFRIRTHTPAHDEQQNDLWTEYIMFTINVPTITITEQEAYTELANEIATSSRNRDIDFVLVDFVPDAVQMTVKLIDGTVLDVTTSLKNANGFVSFKIDSILLNGETAPGMYRGIIQSQLMSMFTDALDTLITQKTGGDYQLEDMTITDSVIIIEAAMNPTP